MRFLFFYFYFYFFDLLLRFTAAIQRYVPRKHPITGQREIDSIIAAVRPISTMHLSRNKQTNKQTYKQRNKKGVLRGWRVRVLRMVCDINVIDTVQAAGAHIKKSSGNWMSGNCSTATTKCAHHTHLLGQLD